MCVVEYAYMYNISQQFDIFNYLSSYSYVYDLSTLSTLADHEHQPLTLGTHTFLR